MKYYLTTPIYYVNAAPHIGHTYTTLAAETIKRFKRMRGYDAVLTTGTDEHGQKVERSAQAAGKTPEEFTTLVSNEFRDLWDSLGIQYDHFIRTTDPRHYKTVQWLFRRCLDNGYIYKGSYTGQYCVSDELYVNDAKPGDPCPDCGRPTETVTEENYFFKLSAFTERLLKHYEEHPDFLQPESRRNEVLSFVRGGLQDLSISRTTINWGIPLDGPHVAYVWFDALISYITAVNGATNEDGYWPADLHLIGKEILRFHAVFWPAFLMAGEVALPKKIFAHGLLIFQNEKMSKSRGNIVRTGPIQEVMGIEALRYFLFREIVFGQDGAFSSDALVNRYNAELANGLGNLASRTLTMIRQYRDGVITAPALAEDHPLAVTAGNTIEAALRSFDTFEFSRGLEVIWQMLSGVDRFIVEQSPWKLAKATAPEDRQKLDDALYASAETLRIAVALLQPVLPQSTANIWTQLGMSEPLETLQVGDLKWGQLRAGQTIGQIAPVFPRIEAKSAIERMKALEETENARQLALMGRAPAEAKAESAEGVVLPPSEKIAVDDFAKVDLRVGEIISAERLKGSDKLLHLKVDIGEPEPRTILAGIALYYEPEKLPGRKVVIVANLHPRKMRGIESNGMIVAGSLEGGKPVLAGFLEDIPVGARLK